MEAEKVITQFVFPAGWHQGHPAYESLDQNSLLDVCVLTMLYSEFTSCVTAAWLDKCNNSSST